MYLRESFVRHEKDFFKLKYTFVHDIMDLLIIFDKEIKNLKLLGIIDKKQETTNKVVFNLFFACEKAPSICKGGVL